MAKIDLKFLDVDDKKTWIQVEKNEIQQDEYVNIVLYDKHTDRYNSINLDVSTSIKFAKTLRTEINKIKGI